MRFLEYHFMCDCPGCTRQDAYTVEDGVGEEVLFMTIEDHYETKAMQDGWYPDDEGLWYCPDCAIAKGLIHDPFEREGE